MAVKGKDKEPLDLAEIRKCINGIDERLQALINERATIAQQVGAAKGDLGSAVDYYRPEREAEVLRAVLDRNEGPMRDEEMLRLFREIMSACLAQQEPLKIGFLGPEGTFTQTSVFKHFGHSVRALPFHTIDEVFQEVECGAADFGVVPIENSTEGSVNNTLDMFLTSPLKISGEIELKIEQQLMGNSNRYWGAVRRWWPSALLAITILVAARILYGAYCGFTSGEFAFFDYGVYTNTAWNLGHGNGFTFLVDKSYLTTHLSFSLMLLGPLFHIWDHPFLLALAQWLMLIGGAILIWRAASRAGVAQARIAALLFLFVAHPFTQQVLLCSFHGVGFYYWLLPWFYYTLAYRRRWCWMPWILLLGLREDAFITLLPLLLYFAIRDRWRAGYVMAVLSLLYGISAIFILYPAINGISLFERRGTEIAGLDGLVKGSNALAARLRSLWWIFLPLVPLAGRRLYPVLIFMSSVSAPS